MRRFFLFLFVGAILFGTYTGLGYIGFHSYWIPVQTSEGSESKDLNRIEVNDPETLIKHSRYRKAEHVIRKKLNKKLAPEKKSRYTYLLGIAYKNLNHTDQAKSVFEKYIENHSSGPDVAASYYQLGLLSSDRDSKESYFRKAALINPRGEIAEEVAGSYSSALKKNPSADKQLFKLSLDFVHNTSPGDPRRDKLVKQMKPLADKVFRSGNMYFDAERYTVRSGDSLSAIAMRYDIGTGWINYTNERPLPVIGNKKASFLRRGEDLVIYPGEIIAEVSIQETRMYILYHDLIFVRTYPVGIGNPKESPTPRGTFEIVKKAVNPSWTKPGTNELIPFGDPENILGTRWLEFGGKKGDGYGVHGTTEPETVGKQVSGGCIRMYNKDVEKLFDLFPQLNGLPDDRTPTVRIMD